MRRRTFFKVIPAIGLATSASGEPQQPKRPETPLRVKKESLHAAEQLIGIELTDAQETMALPGVDRALTGYENLRKIDVPLDTEPAIGFHPALPGKKFATGAKVFRPIKTAAPAFTNVEDLAFATVMQLAELVRTRRVSSTDLTKMYLDRLKRYGSRLNCVVTLTEELALKQAETADKEIRAGKYRGTLHGIPCGVKDLFATKGIKTTWGAEPFRDQVIDTDATVIERLRDAGAVLLAKLSMGALAQGGRWFQGVTRNPWQPEEDRIGSSGSSAGSASSTAAGLVGFSLGTETLGSIVSPCSRCGVTGLRPTYGRISRYGAMGLSWTMDKIGPICRGVEDCAAVLSALYGPDERDLTVGEAAFRWSPATMPLAKMRIGYIKAEFDSMREDERKKLYQQALDALKTAGANLQPMELPSFSSNSLRAILNAEAAAAFDDITRNGEVNTLSGQSPNDWPNSFRTARFIPAVEYLRAQRARTLLMREWDRFMTRWDAFVSPSGSASLLPTNLTGHPAVVVPCGFLNGLPLAIMFTGGVYDEAAPLRVALAYQQATEWHLKRPDMEKVLSKGAGAS